MERSNNQYTGNSRSSIFIYRYWSISEDRPYQLIDLPNKALPSDSTFRQDLLCKIAGDEVLGQVFIYYELLFIFGLIFRNGKKNLKISKGMTES